MPGNVRHDIVDRHLVTTIDDTPYQKWAQESRRELGDGIIRDANGRAVAQLAFRIPLEELNALLRVGDPDAKEWVNSGHQDKHALRRLILRYPHWVACDGSVLRRHFS